MIIYDKHEIKEILSTEDVFSILDEFNGNPTWDGDNIISDTICHNNPNEGSHKLYYYPNYESNSGLFRCYTEGETFDLFELTIRVFAIQRHQEIDLNDAIRYIAIRCGYNGRLEDVVEEKLPDWDILANYERIQEINTNDGDVILLKEYDNKILNNFNYSVKITPWLEEGITQDALDQAHIGFYPGGDQITIPHFDKDNRFIGLRGRVLCAEEGLRFGKYKPLKINGIMYAHPLGYNLYGLNWNKRAIRTMEKAIIMEAEKSVLKFGSYFGLDNNITVACCGSNVSARQIQLLIEEGAKEIILAFDRQFQDIGDDEFKRLKANLMKLYNKYKNYITISFIFDKNKITEYKSSPIDEGPDKFMQLFQERIIL